MPSNKLNRINEDIRLSLSRLLGEVKDPRIHQGLVTVTRTETTSDLKYCKVYVSVIGLENEKDFIRGLKSASGWLRRELGQRVKLRNVPELTFVMDKSIEYGAHISSLLNELHVSSDESEEESDE
ncbi:MAG: 30S ribosome-binding factor RbfA [Oscillospiraceae bacterium]|nr:30S ribosome-binding factor RbfA [Oscillospiraceae bacterium]